MALQVVPTKNPGDTWSPAEHNTYIRENFMECVPGVYTAKGDLFVGSGANAGGVVVVGTNGQVFKTLTAGALDVGWGADFMTNLITAKGDVLAGTAGDTADNFPVGTDGQILSALDAGAGGMGLDWIDKVVSYARYQTNTSQELTVTLSIPTIIDFEDEIFDTSSAVTTGAAWKYTAPADGYYVVMASVETVPETYNGPYYLQLFKNGALNIIMAEQRFTNAVDSIRKSFRGATLVQLSATDYIDIRGGCSDGPINIVSDSDPYPNFVAIFRLGIA